MEASKEENVENKIRTQADKLFKNLNEGIEKIMAQINDISNTIEGLYNTVNSSATENK